MMRNRKKTVRQPVMPEPEHHTWWSRGRKAMRLRFAFSCLSTTNFRKNENFLPTSAVSLSNFLRFFVFAKTFAKIFSENRQFSLNDIS
jgi:hypothetical protein